MTKVLKKQDNKSKIKFNNYTEGVIEYIYFLIGGWHWYYRQESIILFRAAAYNYVNFQLQKYRRAGKSPQDFLDDFGVGFEVGLAQVYLELARAVADGKYKMRALDKLMLPAKRILPTLYTNLETEIEELREHIKNGRPPYYEGIEI